MTSTEVPVAAPVDAQPTDAQPAARKPRRVVDAETVATEFTKLQSLIDSHIENLRQQSASTESKHVGGTGVKAVRSMGALLKKLQKDVSKVLATSKKRVRKVADPNAPPRVSTGGFSKTYPVTDVFADFAGWEHGAMKSRLDISTAIRDYAKAHNLFDAVKKSHMVPDATLLALLGYDPSVPGNKPLTYFYLQKLIAQFQVKTEKVSA